MRPRCLRTSLPILLTLLASAFVCAQDRGRDSWQRPDAIMDSVGIEAGMVVGEAGAGDGYFTFHLARRVGPTGMVYANDIDNDALEKLRARMKREDVKNIETILAEVDNPMFPREKLDMIVMMNVFHHINDPEKWMKNAIHSMKPGAPMVFIETDPDKRSSWKGHFLTKEQILDRMGKTHFTLVRMFDFLERDTIYLFSLKLEH